MLLPMRELLQYRDCAALLRCVGVLPMGTPETHLLLRHPTGPNPEQ